jgi:hypothetical protein
LAAAVCGHCPSTEFEWLGSFLRLGAGACDPGAGRLAGAYGELVSSDRLSVVLAAIADGDGAGGRSVVDRVCAAASSLLSLRGAGVSLMVEGELRGTAGVSEAGVAMLQELQFALGEGPCLEAWGKLERVLEPDLSAPSVARWPAFAQAGVDAGIRAVFAFPLHLGAIRIGVLALYRDQPGALDGEELAYGLVLADVATWVILGVQAGAPPGELHESLANEPPYWSEIHQATGMLSVQLGISLDEAFVRLRGHAFATGQDLRHVARDVVGRRLRLEAAR